MFVYPDSPSPADINSLQIRLGIPPYSPTALSTALTHRTWVEEAYPGGAAPAHLSQQRLEFLGDAFLGAVVARALFDLHPTADEGSLTRLAERFKRGSALATQGRALGLDALLCAGRGAVSQLTGNDNALEDTMEAVIGALVIDGHAEAARRLILGWIAAHPPSLTEPPSASAHPNPIGAINELSLRLLRRPAPEATAYSHGPDHDLTWELTLDLQELGLSVYYTTSNSKKAAKVEACRQALNDAYALGLL